MGRRILCAATLACVVFSTSSCAKGPAAYTFDRAVQFSGPTYDSVWEAVVDLFAERQWPIEQLEKDSGLITTSWVPSDLEGASDCGSSGVGLNFSGISNNSVRFNVVVRDNDSTVAVIVNTSWRATRGSDMLTCTSTGLLESRIHESLRSTVRP